MLEKLVNQQLASCLIQFDIISSCWSGFQLSRSSVSATLKIVGDNLLDLEDNVKICARILMEPSKTFALVYYSIVTLVSRSVDKQHAVINYDINTDEHRVKDLGSLNGTFVNDIRIPDQTYITLKLNDVIRFGYDSNVYVLEKSQHRVPEEALKHEKYTSQLQMSLTAEGKRLEHAGGSDATQELQRTKLEKPDKRVPAESITRRTPLYGQPSWWGDDDAGNKAERNEGRRLDDHLSESTKEMSRQEQEINGNITGYRDAEEKSVYSFRREPSYFEIPTKEIHQPSKPHGTEVQEIPTKDTDTATPAVVQSHASFTIEFDAPGKMKIKDHVTKFSFRQKRPTEVMSAESKVADWLVQNDPSLMRRLPAGDDVYSTKSDLPVHVKTLKGNRHEDGTQSDSEDPVLSKQIEKDASCDEHIVERAKFQRQIRHDPQDMLLGQQAFVIEFFDDDNPRKKRSQSFTHSAHSCHGDPYSVLKAKLEKRKGIMPSDKLGIAVPVPQPQIGPQGNRPVSSSSGPQRASSLKREKTDALISSSSKATMKSFGSMGRRSKLAQEFAAEYFRETPPGSYDAEKITVPVTSQMPLVHTLDSVPLLVTPLVTTPPIASVPPDKKTIARSKTEEEDSLSDTGTYTIETEKQDKEVEEARKMIDQVFGVFETHDDYENYPDIYRPIIDDEKEDHNTIQQEKNESVADQKSPLAQASHPALISAPPNGAQHLHVNVVKSCIVSFFTAVSFICYSSLLYTVHLSNCLLFLDGSMYPQVVSGKTAEIIELDSSHSSRTRRLLPQVPPSDKAGSQMPNISTPQDAYPSYEASEKCDVKQGARKHSSASNKLLIQEDLDPDSLSDTSKSDDDSVTEKRNKRRVIRTKEKHKKKQDWTNDIKSDDQLQGTRNVEDGEIINEPQSTTFYIGTENDLGNQSKESLNGSHSQMDEQCREKDLSLTAINVTVSAKHVATQEASRKFASTTGKLGSNTPKTLPQERENFPTKEPPVSFFRQESFTKDKPSRDVPVNKLPHISSHPQLKEMVITRSSSIDCSHDTQLILKETESVLAALEAKVQTQAYAGQTEPISCQVEDSLSGESDVDTASTVTLVSSKYNKNAAQNNRSISSLQKEKSSSTPSIQEQCNQSSARDRLSEKRRTHPSDITKTELAKRFQLKRSTGTRGSLDLTDDEKSSSLPYLAGTETAISDQEQSLSRPLSRKKPLSQSIKDNQSTRSAFQQVLTRSNSLSTPRPTRTSKLRRARLVDTSDNECADTDKVSLKSEMSATSSTSSKQPTETKKLSRLDILAMPRKRAGSFTVPSDTETSSPRHGFSGRSVELSNTSRKAISISSSSSSSSRSRPGASVKQALARARVSNSKYSTSSSSRRRQQGSDYTSTSEDEYGSNHSSPKQKRSHTSTATQTPKTKGSALGKQTWNARDTEEEDDDEETDPYQHWTEHSAEIARLSQDIAILAREIHVVAGDGDSQSSSGTAPSTSVSSVPNTPASTISTREEITKTSVRGAYSSKLVQHIPEASLNFQKVPPGSTGFKKDLDQNMNDRKEQESAKKRIWNREEVILDNLMLNPVSQLSQAICENTELLAQKMKILFRNKERNWEEIEAKINSENEVPLLKTSNKVN
nr:PREDICTED: centrosomal protein of 170 kDa protein B [Latimeria chalumnae]|eukprot:XP_014340467.1 PREDICTED: centrosomal protein of 170 kDa protein B [Latimeria chalumnae]